MRHCAGIFTLTDVSSVCPHIYAQQLGHSLPCGHMYCPSFTGMALERMPPLAVTDGTRSQLRQSSPPEMKSAISIAFNPCLACSCMPAQMAASCIPASTNRPASLQTCMCCLLTLCVVCRTPACSNAVIGCCISVDGGVVRFVWVGTVCLEMHW